MKLWQPVTALLCCVMFSGCVPMQTNVENLMQPPKLTELQYQADTALRDAVREDFTLKYPSNGKYKSAFNFIDLSGDGVDEAIAFFSISDEYTQLAVLTQRDGKWTVSDILSGLNFCNEVDFVAFEPIGDTARLMVGWGGVGLESNIMAVYNYSSSHGGQPVLELDSRWSYNRMTITDLDQNGKNEILLLVAADSYNKASPTAQLIGESSEGIIDSFSEIKLPRNITAFYPPVLGGIGDNRYGATLDCTLSSGNLCTVTLAWENGELVLPLNDIDSKLFRQTVRTQNVLSADVNGDRVVDIPLEVTAVGYPSGGSDIVYFTRYSNMQKDDLLTVQTAYVNHAKGYRFMFPTSWNTTSVSAQLTPDGSEVVFFVYQSDNLYDHSRELLKIKVYNAQDGQDILESDRYFELASKGTYTYCGALPATPDDLLGITKAQAEKLFSLMTG